VTDTTPEPFTAYLDLLGGTLDPERKVVERRLSDLRGMFLEDPEDDSDPVMYRVSYAPVPETGSDIVYCTTVLQPGRVGREYYMTRGHFHAVRDRAEVYIGLAGQGLLVLATEDSGHRVEPIRSGTVSYVPGGWAHRSVNVGGEPLVFFAAFVGDAGQDYDTIERRGFPVVVLAGEDGPEVAQNPRYRR
jgi:glucose-6-phosphate isomerase